MDYFPNYPMYSYGNLAHAQYQPNAAAYQYSMGNAADSWRRHSMMHHGARALESKPRLAKEEVDKLEREFQRNHKPNSSLKKQLAEEMRVDIARINNWFQNRRAKAKQEKRAQENEARRKSEQASEGPRQDVVQEYYQEGNHHDELRPSAAPFPSQDTPATSRDLETATTDPATKGLAKEPGLSEAATSPAFFPAIKTEQVFDDFSSVDEMLFPSQSPCGFSPLASDNAGEQTGPGPLTLTIPTRFTGGAAHMPSSADSYGSFPILSDSGRLDTLGSLQSHSSYAHDVSDDLSHLSPESAQSPLSCGTSAAFKSPPIDIASRRNTKRPAQLGVSCMRSFSYNHAGMKTGMEMTRRMDAPSPMRRVASATGPMHRGIHKSAGMGPRSPMYFDRNQELLLQMASQTPIPQGPCSSIAPPTPNTPVIISQQSRELTVSSDDDKPYTFRSGLLSAPYSTDPTMRTPPDTPGMIGNYNNGMFPSHHPIQTTFDYNVVDEPLITPGLGGFEAEFSTLSANIPSYVSQGCGSQPSTPSYPTATMGPAFFPAFTGGNAEYNWSDASAASSPGQANRAKQFQFTNMTAQDFNAA